jgi:hypothetical protein
MEKRKSGFITLNASRYGNYVSFERRTGPTDVYVTYRGVSSHSMYRLWDWIQANGYKVVAKADGYVAFPVNPDGSMMRPEA